MELCGYQIALNARWTPQLLKSALSTTKARAASAAVVFRIAACGLDNTFNIRQYYCSQLVCGRRCVLTTVSMTLVSGQTFFLQIRNL